MQKVSSIDVCNMVILNLFSNFMARATTFQFFSFLVLFVIANVLSLVIFGLDKIRSMKGAWRISESKLLFVAFFGPFGAYAGMVFFKHKIRKVKFFLVPIFLLIQLYFISYFVLS